MTSGRVGGATAGGVASGGTTAGRRSAYARSLCEEPKIAVRPELLLLTFFLASSPLYQPNASVFARLAPVGTFLEPSGMVCVGAAFVAAVAMLLRSALSPAREGLSRAGLAVAVALYALSQVAIPVALWFDCATYPALNVLSAVGGASAVFVVLGWVRLFDMDFRSVVFYGGVACLASSLIIWAMAAAPAAVLVVCFPAMAVVGSVAALVLTCGNGAGDAAGAAGVTGDVSPVDPAVVSDGLGERLRNLLGLEWLVLLGLFTCCLMMGVFEFSLGDQVHKSECLSGVLAAVIVLVACFAQRRTPLVILVERLVIPLAILGCFVLRSFPESNPLFTVGAMSVYTPLILVSLFAVASGALFAHSEDFPMPLVCGALLAVSSGATLLGKTYALLVPADATNLGEMSWIVMCVYFALVIAELTVFAWRNFVRGGSSDASWGGAPAGGRGAKAAGVRTGGAGAGGAGAGGAGAGAGADGAWAADGAGAEDRDVLWELRIDRLAEEGGLTAREREMLAYVSRGYGSTYIAKKLFISPSTVRTHVKHVYAKLDVNSREELIARVEAGVRE